MRGVFAPAERNRVPRIRAPAVAHHHIRRLGQQIDNLPLPLIAPLEAQHAGVPVNWWKNHVRPTNSSWECESPPVAVAGCLEGFGSCRSLVGCNPTLQKTGRGGEALHLLEVSAPAEPLVGEELESSRRQVGAEVESSRRWCSGPNSCCSGLWSDIFLQRPQSQEHP